MSDSAPDKVIDVPGVGSVAFPASMTDAQINAAATRLYQDSNPGKKQPPVTSWVDTAVDWLPSAGAMIGGIAGASAGPLGAVGGAALGGAGGEAWRQNINRLRGNDAPASATDAALAIGKEAATDAAVAGVGGAVAKGAKLALPVAGRAAEAVGGAMEKVGTSGRFKDLTGAGALVELLAMKDWKSALGSLTIPPLVRGAGKVVSATGRAAQAVGGTSTKEIVAQRLARIPIQERLNAIANEPIAAAAKPALGSLTEDTALIRASISKGMDPSTAIRIIADGSAEYADALKQAFAASVKSTGPPAPEAVMRLLKTGSFAKLPQ